MGKRRGSGPARLLPVELAAPLSAAFFFGAASAILTVMAEPATKPMTAEEFIAWSATWGEGERWELFHGEPVAMAPQRNRHALVKSDIDGELKRAVGEAGVLCTVLPDGATVRVSAATTYEPDALVVCGPVDLDATGVADPVIIVEVLSPSTRGLDAGLKLSGYFSLPSLRHYLLVDAVGRRVILHSRTGPDGPIATAICAEGPLALDPPGLTVDAARFFARLPPAEA